LKIEKYNEAVKLYYNRLFWYVAKSADDNDLAKDIVQDCFAKLWIERKNIDENKIKPWLFSVAHNSMINHIKREKKSVSIEQSGLHEPQVSINSEFETKEVIEKCLEGLPSIQRSIIILKDLEGYDYKEIGKITGLTMEQVKVYLFRGRQKLKNSIKEIKLLL